MKINLNSKYLIILAVSVSLLTAISSSSTHMVSASTTKCFLSQDGKTTICTVSDESGLTFWDCKKNKDGKTYNCVQSRETLGGSSIPPAINDALTKARIGANAGVNNNNAVSNTSSSPPVMKLHPSSAAVDNSTLK